MLLAGTTFVDAAISSPAATGIADGQPDRRDQEVEGAEGRVRRDGRNSRYVRRIRLDQELYPCHCRLDTTDDHRPLRAIALPPTGPRRQLQDP